MAMNSTNTRGRATTQNGQFFEQEMGATTHDFMFKLVLVGDSEVGKS